MKVAVCVGSSCHLRGSHSIIELLKQRLEETGLADQVDLRAAFAWESAPTGSASRLTTKLSAAYPPTILTRFLINIF